ncbi:hypothetical protein [Flavobacterium sp.]|uniref:hypothetical protein n=1 Tax=Flavobacterium sp. TaxID=239 RepID=UPI0037503826
MKIKLLFTILFLSNLVFSQEEVPFSIRFKDYLRGDLTFIANNIVNQNNGKKTDEAYNKQGENSERNDDLNMSYIDIDNDKSTFSSSSAIFKPTENTKEIVFAGLYWSATYNYPLSFKDNGFYSHEGDRKSNFNEIKIKIPSQKDYSDITGQIIFDGFNNEKYNNNMPYVCFYDLTKMVKSNPYGEYTVANIRSTEGYIEGGVSGGWILYFVYKDDKANERYITLYDGFASVYDMPIEIKLTDFQTPKTGIFNSKISLAALEGDANIDGDKVSIKNTSSNTYFPLSSKNRNSQNLFNSQITIENEQFLDRNPASLNTLGFDALLISLDNQNNQIINNSTTQSELKIESLGDKSYLFSVGFMIDVDKEFYTKITKSPILGNNKPITEQRKKTIKTIKTTKPKNNVTNIKIIVKEILPSVKDNDDDFDFESVEKTLNDTVKLANKTKLPF